MDRAERDSFESLAVLGLAVLAAVPVLVYAFLSPGITDDGQAYSVRRHDGVIFAPVLLLAAAAVGLAAYWLLGRPGAVPRIRRTAVRVTAIVLVAVACAGLIASVARAGARSRWIEARWHDFTSAKDVPSQSSGPAPLPQLEQPLDVVERGVELVRGRARKGRGANTFQLVNLLERTTPIFVTQPHNLFLQALSDTGIVGFSCSGARRSRVCSSRYGPSAARPAPSDSRRSPSRSAGAYVVQSLVDVDWDFVAVRGFLFFVVGVLAARPGLGGGLAPAGRCGAAAVVCVAVTSLVLPWLRARRRTTRTRRSAGSTRECRRATPAARTRSTRSRSSRCTRSAWRRRSAAVSPRRSAPTPVPCATSRTTRSPGSSSATSSCRRATTEDRLRLPRAGHRARPVRQDGRRRANRGLRA